MFIGKDVISSNGLGGLLEKDEAARSYYNALPGYVQEMISQRAQSVRNIDELQRYADQLTRGDN